MNDGGRVLLECDHVVKHFRSRAAIVHAVNDVTLSVNAGETVALVGESGSGKTTVGRMVLGLIRPTSGTIRYRGEPLPHSARARPMRSLRRHIQAVFQDPLDSLDPQMRVGRAIREPLDRMQLEKSPADRDQRVREVADLVGLSASLLRKYPHQLSSGQQQKVSIARALGPRPDFIVLDEPTSVLSPRDRADLVELFRKVQDETGVAYLFITHDLNVVERIANRVAVMYLGNIVEHGPVETIFEEPAHPYTKALLSAVLVPDPRHRGKGAVLRGEIPSPIAMPPGCPFASRCPVALPMCVTALPGLEPLGSRASVLASAAHPRVVACFRAGEVIDGSAGREVRDQV